LKTRGAGNSFRKGAGRENTTANEATCPEAAPPGRSGAKKTTAETSLEKLAAR
jgi:hypothetical protein